MFTPIKCFACDKEFSGRFAEFPEQYFICDNCLGLFNYFLSAFSIHVCGNWLRSNELYSTDFLYTMLQTEIGNKNFHDLDNYLYDPLKVIQDMFNLITVEHILDGTEEMNCWINCPRCILDRKENT